MQSKRSFLIDTLLFPPPASHTYYILAGAFSHVEHNQHVAGFVEDQVVDGLVGLAEAVVLGDLGKGRPVPLHGHALDVQRHLSVGALVVGAGHLVHPKVAVNEENALGEDHRPEEGQLEVGFVLFRADVI